MSIKRKDYSGKRIIDLTGPDGNAFNLLCIANSWADQLGWDSEGIPEEMMGGDYTHLVRVFDRHFGDLVTLIASDELMDELKEDCDD